MRISSEDTRPLLSSYPGLPLILYTVRKKQYGQHSLSGYQRNILETTQLANTYSYLQAISCQWNFFKPRLLPRLYTRT